MSSGSTTGFLITTDPDQKKNNLYKVFKTANSTQSMTILNSARAYKDVILVKFFPTPDLVKAESFIKTAIKSKYINSSSDWTFTHSKYL